MLRKAYNCILAIIFFILLFQVTIAWSATISGTIKMEGRKDKSGVLVTLQGQNISGVSNKDGKYSINNVPPGSYTIIAQKPGYLVGIVSDVIVSNAPVTVDLELIPGDFKIDNQINLLDRIMLASAWKSKEGDANWKSMMDIYEDGIIDEKDKNLLLANWRKGNPNIKLGSLSIESNPNGASVLINGADTGKVTPYTFTGMVVGEYIITLKLENYAPIEVKAQIKEDQIVKLPIVTLDNQPPEFTNWVKEPSNITEDSKGPLKISVRIVDLGGSGMGGKIPQFDYRIGTSTNYSGYKPMKSQGNDIWSFEIPEPVEGWNAFRGKYIYYKAKAEDTAGNSGESEEQQELIDSINDPPSVKIASTFSQWEKGLITITAEASDEDGTISSVKFEYSIDKANWIQINTPILKPPYSTSWDTKTAMRDVMKNIWLRATATDNEGASAEYITTTSFNIDNQPPVTSHDYDGLWKRNDFTITLKANDNDGVGVASINYRLNDGIKQEVKIDGQSNAIVTITKEDKSNVIEYWSVDKLNNEEQHKTLSNIKLDKTPPLFTNWLQDPSDLTENTSGRFRIFVSVSDEVSGLTGKIPQIDYRIGAEAKYDGYENMMSEDGKTWFADIPEPEGTWDAYRGKYVYYKVRCEDVAGNIGESAERIELIDDINDAPIVKIESAFNQWQKGNIKLEATASDKDGTIAGVQFEYSLDKITWRPIGATIVKEPYSIDWDTRTALPQAQMIWIRATALDNDGASSSHIYPTTIGIDNQPPVTSDDYNDLWQKEDFTIKITATDGNGVGISDANIRYRINNGEERNIRTHGHPMFTTEGIHQLEYWGIDDLGNVELHHIIQSVKLDKTKPTFTDWVHDPLDLTENSKGPLRISVRVTDGAGSGLLGKIPQFSYRIGKDTSYKDYVNMIKGEAPDVWYYDIPEPEGSWDAYRGQTIYYKAKVTDVAGNLSETLERQELIDDINDPPTIRILTVFNPWEKGTLKIEADASDIDGAISSVKFDYSFNKVEWNNISTSTNKPYLINWDTKSSIPTVAQSVWIKATATDDDGDISEAIIPNSFKVDNQPPVSKHDYNGAWYNKDFVINLTASDGEGIGVSTISYILNNEEKKEVSTNGQTPVPVNITKEGENTLEYWSIDRLGNEEPHKTLTKINLDKTPPKFSDWVQTPSDLTEDTLGAFRVSVTITDDKSGLTNKIPQIDYRIGTTAKYDGYENMESADGKAWYFDIPEPSETWNKFRGDYVYYRVIVSDIAGNIAESAERKELIDSINDPPIVKLTTQFKDWETGRIKIEAEATDPDGSIPTVKFEYSLNKTNWLSIDSVVSSTGNTYTIEWDTIDDIPELAKSVWVRAVAIDADDTKVLINSEASSKFGIDNQAPIAGAWTKSPSNLTEDTIDPFRVTVSFDDAGGSGVHKVEIAYRIANVVNRDFREMKKESGNIWYYDISEPGGWDRYRGQTLYYRARATDNVGNISPETQEQQELIDDINDPPTGAIVSTFKEWERGTLTIQADAQDQDGQVKGVQFQYSLDKVNWLPIGTTIISEPYLVNWDTSSIEMDPEVWLRVVITDDDGATTESIISKAFGIDNTPPVFANWKLTPANLTESSNESFLRVEVDITDQGSGVDGTKVQLAYRIGNVAYTAYQSMFRQNDTTWFYEIPRPIGNWSSYANQNVFYKARAYDKAGNIIESEELKELIDPTTGSISGKIIPQASWFGARVVIQKDGQNITEGSVSQIDGSYSITSIPAGVYNLLITSPGYGTDKSQTNIEVKLGQNTPIPTVELFRYSVEKILRAQGGRVDFKDSTLKDYSIIVDPNTLLQDGKVVIGFSGNEPISIPNPTVHLIDKAIGIGFEGKDIERPLKVIIPRPIGITDMKPIMAFIFDGINYRVVDRSDITQGSTTLTITIKPQDVKNFSDTNHKFDKALSRISDTVFYVFIARFDEPQISSFDLGIRDPQISLGKITGYAQPTLNPSSKKIAIVINSISSSMDDMVNLISDIRSLKPTNSTIPYYDHVLVFNYDAGNLSVSSNGIQLASELSRVLGTYSGKVDIIAHGTGGLVARHAILSAGADQYIGSLIMLATPNGGVSVDLLKAGFTSFLKKTQSSPTWSYYRDGWQSVMEDSQYIMVLNSQQGKKVNTHYYGIAASNPSAVNQAENNDGLLYIGSADFTNKLSFPSFEESLTKAFDAVNVIPPLTEGLAFLSQTRHVAILASVEAKNKVLNYLLGKSSNISLVEHDIDLIPGNRIENFTVVLKNNGTDTMYGVTAKLSTTNIYIRNYADQQGIERDTAVYGDMPAQTTKSGTFSFYVNPNAKDAIGQQITFTLTITNARDSSIHTIQFSAPIGGNLVRIALNPQTQQKQVVIDVAKDTVRPENDGDPAVEPGETIRFNITLENRSASQMQNVKATLKTDDTRIKGLVGTTLVNMATDGITVDYGTMPGTSTVTKAFQYIKLDQDPTLLGSQVKFTLDIKSGTDIIGRDEFTVKIGADIVVDKIYVDYRLVPGGGPRDIEITFKNITNNDIANIDIYVSNESRYIDITNDREQISLLGSLQSKSIRFQTTIDVGFSGYETFTVEIMVNRAIINVHKFESYFGMRTQYIADWITSDGETTASDKIAEPGELIKLRIARRNPTKETATRVEVQIETTDPAIIQPLDRNYAGYPDIPAGNVAEPTRDFEFRIEQATKTVFTSDPNFNTKGRTVEFTLKVEENRESVGEETYKMRIGGIIRYLPPVSYTALLATLNDSKTLDSVNNNGNGIPEPGETIEISITLINITGNTSVDAIRNTTVTDTIARLYTRERDVDVDYRYEEANYGTMTPSRQTARTFRFKIDKNIEVDRIPFELYISGKINSINTDLGYDTFIIPINK